MKKVLLFSMLFAVMASKVLAAPFVVTDEFTSSLVNDCVIVLDGTTYTAPPVSTGAGTARCVFDVAGVSDGAHSMTMHTVNGWGSSDPVPFSFTKELPPSLSGIRLEF